MPFYNCHIHVFSEQCVPERFLQVGLPRFLYAFAGSIKNLLQTRLGRWVSHKLAKTQWAPLKTFARYASFASVGTMSNQQMVFENILQYYPEGSRFVILTLNMDYMGAGQSPLNFLGQINQIVQLRRLYPDSCLPFLSIDPRMGSANDQLNLAREYIGAGRPFIGIKLYPGLGYFPYDARLEKIYSFCEENNIPIMTHCTPSGSFFLGQLNTAMGFPPTIGTPTGHPHTFGTCGNNIECDAFLEPNRWKPVLTKFPLLKICFAHMGGVKEIWRPRTNNYPSTWYDDVLKLMAQYPNIYTDISYTLFDKKNNKRTWKLIQQLLQGSTQILSSFEGKYVDTIKDRIMFGTDYFMTEQEDTEANLAKDFPEYLLTSAGIETLTRLTETNTENYLESEFFKPKQLL